MERWKIIFSIKGEYNGGTIDITPAHCLEMCYTHRKDGSQINTYELYSTYKNTTLKDIQNLLIEINEVEDREFLIEQERRKEETIENKKFIDNCEVGDILVRSINWYSKYLEFLQIISKQNNEITVKNLKVQTKYKEYYFAEFATKDDFANKDEIKFEVTDYLPSKWDGNLEWWE